MKRSDCSMVRWVVLGLNLLCATAAISSPSYSLSLNGKNQYVVASVPALASNYTLSAWVCLRAAGTVGVLTGTTCGDSVEMLIDPEWPLTGADEVFLELGRCAAFGANTSSQAVSANQWVHVAITVNSNQLVSYFVNGNAAGSWDARGRDLAFGPTIHLGDNAVRHFDGLLDEVQIWSVARSQAEIQAGMNRAPEVAEPNLVAYWPFNEGAGTTTTADASGHGHTGTLVNAPDWSPSVPFVPERGSAGAYGLAFDGVNGYVETATSVIPASGDFTVECWVLCPSAPNTYREVLSQGGSGNAFYIGTDPANNLRVGDTWTATGVAFPLGGWHHVAVVKSSTNTLLYLDGTNRLARGSAIVNPAASGLRFGRQYGYATTEYWAGSLDDVRVWSRALSAAEIQTNRTSMPTGMEAGLVAAWEFQEGARALCTSIGAKKITGTLNGGTTWSNAGVPWAVVPADYALSFNGSSSFLDAGTAVIPTNGDFTVECWALCPTAPNTSAAILSQGSSGNAFSIGLDGGNNLRLGESWGTVSPAVAFPFGGWHHFAVVKSSTNTLFYLDGTSRLNRGSAILNPTASALRLGRQYATAGEYWPGSVDDVRIWNRALSGTEIQNYSTQPPTGMEPGLVAAWEFNEGAGVATTASGSTQLVLQLTNGVTWLPSGVVWMPALVTPPTGLAAVAGTAAQLSVLAADRWPLSYQWYWQGHGAIAGATNATLAWNSLAVSNAGVYYVVVSDPHGAVVSGNARLTVQFIASQPTNVSAWAGLPAQLNVVATDAVPVSYQWYWQDHGAIAGATNATLGWSSLAVSNAGVYYVVVSDAFGTNASRPALVNPVNGQWVGADPLPHLVHNPFTDPGVTLSTPLAAVAAGYGHGLAVRTDGSVVAWGNDCYGQAQVPASVTNAVAVAAGKYHSLALNADGSVVAWGQNSYDQTSVPASATNVVALAAGDYHSLAVKADGTVVAWGNNDGSQTDVPASAFNVVAVAAGQYHSLALKSDGTVVAWGLGVSGQTSVPGSATNVVALAARADRSLALRADGTVLVWGVNTSGPKDAPPTATNVVALAAGDYHSVAARADGSVVAWGNNDFGQVNVPASATDVVAVAAGYNYCLGLKRDGSVIAWGGNTDGAYNNTGQLNVPSSARTICATSGAVNADAAGSYTLTYSFTDNAGSRYTIHRTVEVGSAPVIVTHPTSTSAPVGTPAQLSVLASDSRPISYQWYWQGHRPIPGATNSTLSWNSLAVSNAGAYYVVCRNAFGPVVSRPALLGPVACELTGANPMTNLIQSGFTDPGATQTTPAAAIAAGQYHSLALTADGMVIGWGNHAQGETSAPASATNLVGIGGGDADSVALKADGTVVGWGNTSYPRSAVPAFATNVVALAAGYWHNLALKADGTVVGWGYNNYGQTDVPVSTSNAVAIAAGSSHSLALKADGTVIAWGYNSEHQTEVPAAAANSVGVAGGVFHSLALKADGTVIGWGENSHGQTTSPASATNVVAIAAGRSFSLALRADGKVVAWGWDLYGQTDVPSSATDVVAIAAGGYHALALKADGTVVAWGMDAPYGQASVPSWTQRLLASSGTVNPELAGTYTLTYSFTNGLGVVVATNRTVVVWQAAQHPPILTDLAVVGGTVSFTLSGESGQTVVVEACTNLTAPCWVPVQTNTLSSGPVHFGTAVQAPVRFYRLRSP
jgi:alpha-tubulin suppressor-like RCC1 family protein